MPLTKAVNIILERVYTEKLFNIKLSKQSLKKLILDSCNKTAFSFNDKIYEQIDGVSMGSPLGSFLANIILTEFEKLRNGPFDFGGGGRKSEKKSSKEFFY